MKILFLVFGCIVVLSVEGIAFQGPGGEVIGGPSRPPITNHPPPVDTAAVARAEQAARARRRAAVADQVELAIKNGNKAMEDYLLHQSNNQLLLDAETDFKKAAQLKPSDWRAYSGLGDLYYWKSRLPESEAAYRKAIALRPRDAQLQLLLARTYSNEIGRIPESDTAARNSKLEQQLIAYQRAAELDPSPNTRMRLADALGDRKRYNEAIAIYKSILANLDTHNVKSFEELLDLHDDLARTYQRAERYAEAVEEYKVAVRLKPDWWIQYDLLAQAQRNARQYADAIETYRTLDRLHPDSEHETRMAEIYADAGEYEKALAIFNKKSQEKPDDWEPVASIGYVYYLQKDYAKSLEQMNRALRMNPDVPGLRYFKGVDHLKLGQRSEALQEYEILKTRDQTFAAKLKAEIDKM